jgi:hypothetical protein
MIFHRKPASPHRSGVASHTALVSLGPARALSSHLRHIYRRKYEGRHRYAEFVFGFDVVLIGTIIALAALVISFWIQPVRPPSLALTYNSQPLVAGSPVAFEAHISTADGVAHHNVRMQWLLPPGAEILRSQPTLNADGSMYLGDVKPGQEMISLVVVRLFQPAGSDAGIGFSLYSRDGLVDQELTGLEHKTVAQSSLTANVVPEFKADAVAPEGVVIPIEITNPTDLQLPFVRIDVTGPKQDRVTSQSLGTLQSHETRFVFIPLGSVSGEASLSWTVFSEAREMSRGSWKAKVGAADFPVVRGEIVSEPDKPTSVKVDIRKGETGTNPSLLAVHPLLDHPIQVFNLSGISLAVPTSTIVSIPSFHRTTGTSHEFLVAFTRTAANGSRELGPAVMGSVRVGIPFSTQVRYTSSAGDQLGVGPNPPRAGFETRYWVFWELGPVSETVKNVSVQTELPAGVRTTGNVSAADGGTWQLGTRDVTWTLPSLGPEVDVVSGSSGPAQAVFGFEILVKPGQGDVGQTLQLVGTSTASGVDPHTGLYLQSEDGQKTSVLPEDSGSVGAGIVLP